MRHFNLLTGRSGQLHGQGWVGDEDPLGVVVMVHGLGDHSGRCERLARELTERRWAVFAFDLPGHGRSPGVRGRVDRYDGLLQDIAAARRSVADRLPGLPQLLFGHSMGGNLALNYSLRREAIDPAGEELAGLVLCAPMLSPPAPLPRPAVLAAWLTGCLVPWVRLRRDREVEKLTRDAEQAAAIKADRWMHSQISIYLATQLVSQGRWALDHARDVALPTLIVLGDADALIDKGACENLAIRIGSLATLVRLPQMRHDLFHDQGSEQAVERVSAWMQPFLLPATVFHKTDFSV